MSASSCGRRTASSSRLATVRRRDQFVDGETVPTRRTVRLAAVGHGEDRARVAHDVRHLGVGRREWPSGTTTPPARNAPRSPARLPATRARARRPRSPGRRPRCASVVAICAVCRSSAAPRTTRSVSHPSTSTGRSGRSRQCRAQTSSSVGPPVRRRPSSGQRPGAIGRLHCGSTAGHSLAVMTARRIDIVPHTHWDREWYKSYQDFRLALVELIDTLIPLLERDASYPHFMLDGQMAVVDDYLEVRPEAEGRLRALAAAGRVSMGPWYILMDEFLASGETIVRDLQMGLARGAAFGGVMDVGYLPDMFGHIAQMPQILRLAGFRDAVVWRGVPSQVTKNAFVWVAPDGSSVRAEYLPVGYGNGAALPDDAKALIRRTQRQRRGDRGVPDRRPALHERVRPLDAPAMARTRGRRGQRPARGVRLRGDVARALPGLYVQRRLDDSGGRTALGQPRQHVDGRHVQPGRRQAPGGGRRAGARAARRTPERPLPAARVLPRPAPRAGLA